MFKIPSAWQNWLQRRPAPSVAQNARRLGALWEIVTAPQVGERARLLAMLEAGADALRPGQPFHGQLTYLDGDETVIMAGARIAPGVPPSEAERLLVAGVRFLTADGVQNEMLASGGTIGWNDVLVVPALARRKRLLQFNGRAVIGSSFPIGNRTYFLIFYSNRPAVPRFTHDDYAYIDVLASFFAHHLQQRVGQATEVRLEQSAQRATALKEVAATAPRLDDRARLLAMLQASASALRTGQTFHAQLSVLDGNDVVVIAGTRTQSGALINDTGRYPLEGSVPAELLAAGCTIGWDDALNVPTLQTRARIRSFGWRAVIGSAFRVGGRTHFLCFGSFEPTEIPFTQDDCAYVELLSSLFASNLHQGTQRDRIREQLEIDTLTGLPNRATFRKAVTQTMASTDACAMLIINVDAWRGVVGVHGHQTADALLVELGAAVAALSTPGESVARLTGDTFAMLLLGWDASALRVRVQEILTILSRGYSIGDRLGKEYVSLTVSAGLALAQGDMKFELLFMNAEAALAAAKEIGPGSLAVFNRSSAA